MGPFGKFLITIALPTLCMCWVAFLAFEAVAGASGYRTLAAMREEARVVELEVDAMRTRRQWLESRTHLLHSRSLDPDMVDERVRGVLGYAREGDYVIPRNELRAVIKTAQGPLKRR